MPDPFNYPPRHGFGLTDAWLFCTIILPLFAILALGVWHDAWGLMSATISLCTSALCATWRDVSRTRRIVANDL
jgi:hypothetical protein